MFGISKIRPGAFVFVVRHDEFSNYIVIGRIMSENKNKTYHVRGTSFRPIGLIERIRAGRAQGKPMEALNDPDPNNCIFLIIDRVEYETFNDLIDARYDKIIPINENRFFVLDGWLKENFSDLFANFFKSSSSEEKLEAREVIIRRMNSLISPELKDHVYAVARGSRIL
ncbi:MAG TPA: hypothetical protein VM682_02170 [Bacillus sp. (in: firmicutes)]|nr:hypothetical protein [Bacillus sp. (in: firmicutes)]